MYEPYEFDVRTLTLMPPLRWIAETVRSDGKHRATPPPRRLQVEAAVALTCSCEAAQQSVGRQRERGWAERLEPVWKGFI